MQPRLMGMSLVVPAFGNWTAGLKIANLPKEKGGALFQISFFAY